MMRKLLLVAVAAAAPIGLIAIAGSAGAGAPKINATTDTVTCTNLSGSVKFSPPVTTSESAGTGTTALKASFSGCSSNAVGLTVTSGSAKGTLTSTRTSGENGCTALAGGSTASGPVTIAWKTTPKLSSGSSVLAVKSESGGLGGDGNATFTIPGSTPNGPPSGSFQGTNSGSGDVANAQTTESATSILSTCEGKKGLKTLDIESPQSGNALSLS